MPTTIMLRTGTTAEWTAANPVLVLGEPGYDSEAQILKVGNGVTPWAGLPAYLNEPEVSATHAMVLTATAGDQRDRIQAFLAAPSPIGAKRLVGSFEVAGTVTVPAGLFLDLSAATITQTSSNSLTLRASGPGATIHLGSLVGKGTDYVPGATSPKAIGIDVTAPDVTIEKTRFRHHAGAAVRASNASRLRLDVTIVGVGDITTIPAMDGACYGVYLGSGCTDVTVDNVIGSDLSIGLIASLDSANLDLRNATFDRIPGQHGVYLQNGTGLKVGSVRGTDINLNCMKVQLRGTATSNGAVIGNVSGLNVGDAVLCVNNTDRDMATATKHRGLTIGNVRGHAASRVLYLANVRGANVGTVSGEDTRQAVLTVLDVQDALIGAVESRVSGREVVAFSCAAAIGSTGSSTRRVTIGRVRAYNPCNDNSSSCVAAVSIGPGSATDQVDILLDGISVDADNGAGANTFMRFGLDVHPSVETTRLRVRGFRAQGWTAQPARLAAATKNIGEWTDCESTTTVVNFPSGLLTRVGSVGARSRWVINASPTNGVVQQGDVIHNSAPAAGGTPGWIATSAGGLHRGTWAPATTFALNDWRRATATGRVFECVGAGTSGGSEPSWNAAAVGDTFVDGGVRWTCRATTCGAVKAMASLAG